MNTNETFRDYSQDAQTELAKLREKVETLMSERVTPAVTALAGQAEDVANAAGEKFRENADSLAQTVRDKPLAAIGMAALAGFVFAALVRR